MSEADEIENLVPYLRRFARACLGNAETADDVVVAALTELVQFTDLHSLRDERPLQHHLYRLVAKKMNAQFGDGFNQKAWRAFILIEVEGISLDETAAILGVSSAEIALMLRAVNSNRRVSSDRA
ncbi:MAG: hypothetical protein NXH72_13810 [Hyphomonadaceae bacterium]|nr:hypothetical protein [Hyphomonadaceae bacterium]